MPVSYNRFRSHSIGSTVFLTTYSRLVATMLEVRGFGRISVGLPFPGAIGGIPVE